jgi:hypothetical protein
VKDIGPTHVRYPTPSFITSLRSLSRPSPLLPAPMRWCRKQASGLTNRSLPRSATSTSLPSSFHHCNVQMVMWNADDMQAHSAGGVRLSLKPGRPSRSTAQRPKRSPSSAVTTPRASLDSMATTKSCRSRHRREKWHSPPILEKWEREGDQRVTPLSQRRARGHKPTEPIKMLSFLAKVGSFRDEAGRPLRLLRVQS